MSRVAADAITTFSGEYRFLSNFWPCGILYDGLDFPSVEHAYQAAKTSSRMYREFIRDAKTAGEAKRMGQRVPLIPGFYTDGSALKVMEALVTQKFVRHKDLRELLLRTGQRQLVEGNIWNDRTWGMVYERGEWTGENHLGILLMLVRERIRLGALKGLE
jgi:hypothetical protein